jgi:predicted nuclease of predicted toxin-antitoxin system
VKLLFDENLPPELTFQLADLHPNSEHAREVGLARAPETAIWQYAFEHGFIIVSKDEDFHHLSFLRGAPPKVIGIALGNCFFGDFRGAPFGAAQSRRNAEGVVSLTALQ